MACMFSETVRWQMGAKRCGASVRKVLGTLPSFLTFGRFRCVAKGTYSILLDYSQKSTSVGR